MDKLNNLVGFHHMFSSVASLARNSLISAVRMNYQLNCVRVLLWLQNRFRALFALSYQHGHSALVNPLLMCA